MNPHLLPLFFLFLDPQSAPIPAAPVAEPQSSEAALLQAAKLLADGGDLIGAAKTLSPRPKRAPSAACAQQRLRYLLQEENLVFLPAREALKAKRPDAAEQLLGPLFREDPTLKTTRRMMAEIRAQRSDLFLTAGQPALALAWMQGAMQLNPAYAAKAEAIEGALENILQSPVLLVIQDGSMNQLLSAAIEDRVKKQPRQFGLSFSLVPADGQRLAGIQIPKPDLRDQELRRAPQLVLKPGFRTLDNDEFNRLTRDLNAVENDLIQLLIQRRRCQPAVAPASPPPSLKKPCAWLPAETVSPEVYGWPLPLELAAPGQRGVPSVEPLEPSGGSNSRPANTTPVDRGSSRPTPAPLEPTSGDSDRGNSRPPPSPSRPAVTPRHVDPLPEPLQPSQNTSPNPVTVTRGTTEGVKPGAPVVDKNRPVTRGTTEGVKPGAPVVDNRRGPGTVTRGTTQPADGPWNTGRIPERKHPVVPPLPAQNCQPISCDVYDRLILEKECEIRRLRLAVCQTPPDIQVPDDQQWAYQISTYERSLDGHALLQLGQRRDQVSSVQEAIDQVTDRPNPNFNVPADPLILPSELEMTKSLGQPLSAKILEHIAQLAWQDSLAELLAVPRPTDATAAMELDLMISLARMKSKDLYRHAAITAADIEKLPKHP